MPCETCHGLGCWAEGHDDVAICPDCKGYGRELVTELGSEALMSIFEWAVEAQEAGATVELPGDWVLALMRRGNRRELQAA